MSHHLEGVARAEFTFGASTKLGEASVLANTRILETKGQPVGRRDQHVAKSYEDRLPDLDER